MSKSSRPLLIAAGCSNTDQNQPYYISANIFTWPQLVSDYLGMDLLNIGQGGTGNHKIANSIIDTVLEHQDREIKVMALWTSGIRLNIFDVATALINSRKDLYTSVLQYHNKVHHPEVKFDKNKFQELLDNLDNISHKEFMENTEYADKPMGIEDNYQKEKFEFEKRLKKMLKSREYNKNHDETILKYSTREIWKTTKILKSMGIQSISKDGLSLTLGIPWMNTPYWKNDPHIPLHDLFWIKERTEKLIDTLSKDKYLLGVQELTRVSFFDDNIQEVFADIDDKWLIPKNGHPNQEGHEKIAESFIKAYLKTQTTGQEFVYE